MADCISCFSCIKKINNKVKPNSNVCHRYQTTSVYRSSHSNQSTPGSYHDKMRTRKIKLTKLCRRLFKLQKKSLCNTYKNLSVFNDNDYLCYGSELDNISCTDSSTSDWSQDQYTSQDGLNLTISTNINKTDPVRASLQPMSMTTTPTLPIAMATTDDNMNKYKQQSKLISQKMQNFQTYQLITLAVL